MTISHYINHMDVLTEQFFLSRNSYKRKKAMRVYLKDIDCPTSWADNLKQNIPAFLFYLNDNIGDLKCPATVDKPCSNPSGRRQAREIAIAGDLMSTMPPEMRALNLMCYIGHEGTYTPAHHEMCGSLGHNIMVEASTAICNETELERPGSSLWFMTRTSDRHLVAEYWHSTLGHDIEVESHFAQISAWRQAPFQTYVVEQKPGDFILIPPLAPHQVWNRGTRTMKIAWNRTTVESLEFAFNEALPKSRLACRNEEYKNKSIVYYTLCKYSNLLLQARTMQSSPEQTHRMLQSENVRQVCEDFKRLFNLFQTIMLSEMFSSDRPEEPCEFIPYDSNVICAYCYGNIFNRFLTCKSCTHALDADTEEPYDICMDCFVMGRSCACQSNLTWVEQWKWDDLVHMYEGWRKLLRDMDENTENAAITLQEAKTQLKKKTLAQICQEQLKARPWVNIKEPRVSEESVTSGEETQGDNEDSLKKSKERTKGWHESNKICHACLHYHPKWKMAVCTNCDLWWCFETLYRAHDILPRMVLEDADWKCPHCKGVCNTENCCKDPRQTPYVPKGTLLGHDTKEFADARSIECLVDFGVSNLKGLRNLSSKSVAHSANQEQEDSRAKERVDNSAPSGYSDDHNLNSQTSHDNEMECLPTQEVTAIDSELSVPRQDNDLPDPVPHSEKEDGCDIIQHVHEQRQATAHLIPIDTSDNVLDDRDASSANPDPILSDLPQNTEQETRSKKRCNQDDDQGDKIEKPPTKKQKVAAEEVNLNSEPSDTNQSQRLRRLQNRAKLNEAKLANRFMIVKGILEGKSRRVALKTPREYLEALAANSFWIVFGRLRGKSKMVTLKLPSERSDV